MKLPFFFNKYLQKSYFIKSFLTLSLAFSILSGLISCTEEIDLQLNAASPKIIIEGAVTDQRVPYEVKISRSINFNTKNEYPPVRGAFVLIADNAGNSDTLKEVQAGVYRTTRLRGTVNRRYTLTVKVEGQEYIASSVLSRAVGLDSLTIQKDELAEQFTNSNSTYYQILPIFTDPRDEANYYFFNVFTKKEKENDFYNLLSDINSDGLENVEPIYFTSRNSISKDSLTVEMWCLDKGVHTYFNSLNQLQNNQSGTPTNPITNIKGGALGYFSAHSIRSKKIVIP